jgi:hypothetical protein
MHSSLAHLCCTFIFHTYLRSSLPVPLYCLAESHAQQFCAHRVFGSKKNEERKERPSSVFLPFIDFHPSVLVGFLKARWFDPSVVMIPNCFYPSSLTRGRC